MKIYSKSCDYAIRALAQLRHESLDRPFSLKALCKKARISESFTRKTFQALVRKKILVAKHGPGGGYQFRGSPDSIALLDVVEAIEGEKKINGCISRHNRACDEDSPCEVHEIWKQAKKTLLSEFKNRTVGSLIKGCESKKEERV